MAHAQEVSNDHFPKRLNRAGEQRTRSDDSWVEISSQPSSSSSLSSGANDILTSGLRVHHSERSNRRRRTLRPGEVASLNLVRRQMSSEGTSSQEEYEESESESDRVMTSSGEGPHHLGQRCVSSTPLSTASESPHGAESEDESRTAVNYPMDTESCFTPQPNAFSHPPAHPRSASQPSPGSYFPTVNRVQSNTLPRQNERSHVPRNILGASYNPTVHHEEALRASLSTLLSCAAAARGLKDNTRPQIMPEVRGNRVEPMNFRLVPESALPSSSSPNLIQDSLFRPTLRRASTTTVSTSSDKKEAKRRSRPSSKERRAVKKARHVSNEELFSPTLLTWVVSAGVVVVLSALSFSAGYSIGREAGMLEAGAGFDAGDRVVRDCAREASRSGLGLKRSLARSAVQV